MKFHCIVRAVTRSILFYQKFVPVVQSKRFKIPNIICENFMPVPRIIFCEEIQNLPCYYIFLFSFSQNKKYLSYTQKFFTVSTTNFAAVNLIKLILNNNLCIRRRSFSPHCFSRPLYGRKTVHRLQEKWLIRIKTGTIPESDSE